MRSILDIIGRLDRPIPWEEGDNIPWNEPGFSARMLREHLSQAHNAASRRTERVDAHVDWIHQRVLAGTKSRILDLGCGPGLYATRLAHLGHQCTGIDYSPASIEYAKEQAAADGVSRHFIEGDIRTADYGQGFDLVMFIYGELNVFSPADAQGILSKARAALRPGGQLLLEPDTADAVEYRGRQGRSWYSSAGGLFSTEPHVVLHEHSWDPDMRASTTRYFIIDAETHRVTRHAGSSKAYDDDELRALLARSGFGEAKAYDGLSGVLEDMPQGSQLGVWTARRP